MEKTIRISKRNRTYLVEYDDGYFELDSKQAAMAQARMVADSYRKKGISVLIDDTTPQQISYV